MALARSRSADPVSRVPRLHWLDVRYVDTPPYLELLDPARYHGMREAAIGCGFHSRTLARNDAHLDRGYALLPDVVRKLMR
jgi:hypothetical protein